MHDTDSFIDTFIVCNISACRDRTRKRPNRNFEHEYLVVLAVPVGNTQTQCKQLQLTSEADDGGEVDLVVTVTTMAPDRQSNRRICWFVRVLKWVEIGANLRLGIIMYEKSGQFDQRNHDQSKARVLHLDLSSGDKLCCDYRAKVSEGIFKETNERILILNMTITAT